MAAPTGTRLWESINESGCCSLPRLAHNIKCSIKGQLKDRESFLMIDCARKLLPDGFAIRIFSHLVNQALTHT
jgi:hypothetical protein